MYESQYQIVVNISVKASISHVVNIGIDSESRCVDNRMAIHS